MARLTEIQINGFPFYVTGDAMMSELDKDALDRHITGNYGEDQFRDWDSIYGVDDYDPPTCQVSNCDEDADDGVLCTMHQVQADEAAMDQEAYDDPS